MNTRQNAHARRTTRALLLALGLAATAAVQAAAPANTTLANGRSIYGVPVAAEAAKMAQRVVDVASSRVLNIDCAEIVTFRSGSQQFTWKFDVVGHRAVALQDIAPAGFDAKGLKVYVSPNDGERN